MTFHQVDTVRYFTFDALDAAGVLHGAITRCGGVSPQPWSSLNVGATVGDDSENVQENRRRSFQAFDRSLHTLFDVWQVHSATVVCTDAPRPLQQKHIQADAILTNQPGVTLFMRFADCTPIFLFDPVKKTGGLVHAGWQGTVKDVAGAAVDAMQRRYGSRPGDILAGIGPSIAAHHYEVGPEVVAQVQAVFGTEAFDLLQFTGDSNSSGKATLDLWMANRVLLRRAGVFQIETAGICTACQVDDWYSHRAEKGRTGRFGAVLAVAI